MPLHKLHSLCLKTLTAKNSSNKNAKAVFLKLSGQVLKSLKMSSHLFILNLASRETLWIKMDFVLPLVDTGNKCSKMAVKCSGAGICKRRHMGQTVLSV